MQIHGCGLSGFPPFGREGHSRLRGKPAPAQKVAGEQQVGSQCQRDAIERESALLNHPHHRIANGGKLGGLQLADLSGNEAGVGGEKFAGTRKAR
jgi:hypothetical protein